MPLVWSSSSAQMAMLSNAATSGERELGEVSPRPVRPRSTAPCSASWLTARAVIPLNTDPRLFYVSAVDGSAGGIGVPEPGSTDHAVADQWTTAAPGIPAS